MKRQHTIASACREIDALRERLKVTTLLAAALRRKVEFLTPPAEDDECSR